MRYGKPQMYVGYLKNNQGINGKIIKVQSEVNVGVHKDRSEG